MQINKRSINNSSDEKNSTGEQPKLASETLKLKNDNTNEAVPEELVKKKKARFYKSFSEDILVSEDGLPRIYKEFPKICKFRGRGSEAKDLQKLMTMYTEWAFQLHPSLACSDLLMRTENHGSKARVKSCLTELRELERHRFLVCDCMFVGLFFLFCI
jgi:hypothetical protein